LLALKILKNEGFAFTGFCHLEWILLRK